MNKEVITLELVLTTDGLLPVDRLKQFLKKEIAIMSLGQVTVDIKVLSVTREMSQ